MNRFKNCAIHTNICTGCQTQTANQTGAQVRNNITVQVRANQYIVIFGMHHQSHAHRIHNTVIEFDLRVFLRDFLCNTQEQTVCAFHDVCLMYSRYFFSAFSDSIVKSITTDAFTAFSGNQLDAFCSIFAYHMFNACIQVFCIFTNDHQINVFEACDNAGICFSGANVCVKIECFTQGSVYAAEACANRCSDGAFQGYTVFADGIDDMIGQGSAVFFDHGCTGFHFIPFNCYTSSFYNSFCGCNYFGAAAVTGDQSYFICHIIYLLSSFVGRCPPNPLLGK